MLFLNSRTRSKKKIPTHGRSSTTSSLDPQPAPDPIAADPASYRRTTTPASFRRASPPPPSARGRPRLLPVRGRPRLLPASRRPRLLRRKAASASSGERSSPTPSSMPRHPSFQLELDMDFSAAEDLALRRDPPLSPTSATTFLSPASVATAQHWRRWPSSPARTTAVGGAEERCGASLPPSGRAATASSHSSVQLPQPPVTAPQPRHRLIPVGIRHRGASSWWVSTAVAPTGSTTSREPPVHFA